MRLPISAPCNGVSTRSRIIVIQCFALAGFLSACTIGSTSRTPITTSSPRDFQESGECSLFGRLVCKSIGSGTCTRSRKGGTRVDICGTMTATGKPPQPNSQRPLANRNATSQSSVQLSWQDNSDNETGFLIERCDKIFTEIQAAQKTVSCRGSWKTVGTVGVNIMTYIDDTVTPKQTYIYRVKATNKFGSSATTPEAVITAPANSDSE